MIIYRSFRSGNVLTNTVIDITVDNGKTYLLTSSNDRYLLDTWEGVALLVPHDRSPMSYAKRMNGYGIMDLDAGFVGNEYYARSLSLSEAIEIIKESYVNSTDAFHFWSDYKGDTEYISYEEVMDAVSKE